MFERFRSAAKKARQDQAALQRNREQTAAIAATINELIWLGSFNESMLQFIGDNIYASIYVEIDGQRVRQAQGTSHNVVDAIRDLRRILVEQGQLPNEEISTIVRAS